MSTYETREHRAPLGCRDPKLWAVAENLLAVHSAEVAACVACRNGVPCTVLRSCVEAQDQAMASFPTRRLSGEEHAAGQVRHRAVGRARVRQCGTWRRFVPRWVGGARPGKVP
jgi:hypothetical protein